MQLCRAALLKQHWWPLRTIPNLNPLPLYNVYYCPLWTFSISSNPKRAKQQPQFTNTAIMNVDKSLPPFFICCYFSPPTSSRALAISWYSAFPGAASNNCRTYMGAKPHKPSIPSRTKNNRKNKGITDATCNRIPSEKQDGAEGGKALRWRRRLTWCNCSL